MNNYFSHAHKLAKNSLYHAHAAARHASKRATELQDNLERRSAPRLSVKEQVFFVKRLAFLIRANVPILEGLYMVKEQASSRRHTRVVTAVIEDVSNGFSLARSLGKFPNIFGEFSINIIKVGESSGTLSQNLEYLADELKKRMVLRRKVMGAFVYPAVIAFATLAITAFLMLYLFPKILPIFASLQMTLPFSTRVVMWISLFLQNWGLTLIGVLVVAGIAVAVGLRKSKRFHYLFDKWILSMPVVGPMIMHYNLATATRTLGLLLRSGITLSVALPLTADTTKNLVYKKEYGVLADKINRGEQLSTYLRTNRRYFPEVMSQMVAIGERSGNLSNTLVYLSEFYEAEVDDFTKNLSSLIEPAMMVVMGIVVGFVAVSIITPIYGITQSLNP